MFLFAVLASIAIIGFLVSALKSGGTSRAALGRKTRPAPRPDAVSTQLPATTPSTTERPAQGKPDLPDSLPVSAKRWFFSQSERTLFLSLLKTVEGTPYSVFPNVRLNDIFLIAKSAQDQRGTYARLRDKHVDFLIVEGSDFRPVLAVELDGASHDNEVQQFRDEVKNVAFRSAGVPLIRLDAQKYYSPAALRTTLSEHLTALQAVQQSAD